MSLSILRFRKAIWSETNDWAFEGIKKGFENTWIMHVIRWTIFCVLISFVVSVRNCVAWILKMTGLVFVLMNSTVWESIFFQIGIINIGIHAYFFKFIILIITCFVFWYMLVSWNWNSLLLESIYYYLIIFIRNYLHIYNFFIWFNSREN